jgi:multicomponent Na+:H+ antiporter subunit D
MVVPICIVALLSILLGFYPDLFFGFFRLASAIAASVLGLPGGPGVAGLPGGTP